MSQIVKVDKKLKSKKVSEQDRFVTLKYILWMFIVTWIISNYLSHLDYFNNEYFRYFTSSLSLFITTIIGVIIGSKI